MSSGARSGRRGGGHESEDEERWLITYADMITLLMAFFIMMYAMSIVNLGKFNALAVSVRSGFGGDAPESMYDALGVFDAKDVTTRSAEGPGLSNSLAVMKDIADSVRSALPQEDPTDVSFYVEHGVVTIRVRADDVLFARGSASLNPRAMRILRAVAKAIRPLPHKLRVEGHTCDLPIRSGQFRSNWELSAQRAISVVLFLVQQEGFPPQRLSAVGYADTVPLVTNTSEANRALNRRIDVVLEKMKGPTAVAPGKDRSAAAEEQDIRPQAVDLTRGIIVPPVDTPETGAEQ